MRELVWLIIWVVAIYVNLLGMLIAQLCNIVIMHILIPEGLFLNHTADYTGIRFLLSL